MSDQEKMISLEDELSSFGRYFDNNDRCILSAPFGEGKSFFLNEFIKEKCKDYDFITLYPTNYQVCDNKDIFEYIKRDILLALLALDPDALDGKDKTRVRIVWEAILSGGKSLVSSLFDINLIGTNMSVANIVKALRTVVDNIDSEMRCNGNPLKAYLEEFENQKGSIYELDPVSNLIATIIKDRKEENTRPTVLVIEDLDRVDPSHIFRILNIFSAHFADDLDNEACKNKFGFDKVLLVCDYNNIEKIYKHKYGNETDFKGYISKFSAVPPFEYCIRSKIAKHISWEIGKYVQEPVVSALLADEIVASTKPSPTELKENIRNIKERIEFASKQYKVERIEVEVNKEAFFIYEYLEGAKGAFDTLFVTTEKPLLSYISICKAFKLDYKQILIKIMEMQTAYGEPNHIVDLCGSLTIPLMQLKPYLDLDLIFKLGKEPIRKQVLSISKDGEILEVLENPTGGGILNFIKRDDLIERLVHLEQYLY